MIRKALWPARYAPEDIGKVHIPEDPDEFDHNDHCINSIRESIMCHGDVSVNVWQWDEEEKWSKPHFDNVHMCRSHDSLLGWAKDHSLANSFNDKIHVVVP